jgi:hypothetical protein
MLDGNTIIAQNANTAPVGGRNVDLSKGSVNCNVSAQWYTRPDDQKYCSLEELYTFTKARFDRSRSLTVNSKQIRLQAPDKENPDLIEVFLPGQDQPTVPTHWAFGQACSLVNAPASYLRTLPGKLAAFNLQYGLINHRSNEQVKIWETEADDGSTHLDMRAMTGPAYGRIGDFELVDAVKRIADRTGTWKIPGVMKFGSGYYDPDVPVTKQTTTLYASDRDVFMFLVDDKHPIEVGKLRNGEPDLMFRGFYAWNSEVGSKTIGLASMYLRAVCQNRNLFGVENFQEMTFRHSANAPSRFADEAIPALESFSNRDTQKVIAGVKAAKDAKVASDDDERKKFLKDRGFSMKQAADICDIVLEEEGTAAESIWEFCQGITAYARRVPHQDDRVDLVLKAKKLLDKVAA